MVRVRKLRLALCLVVENRAAYKEQKRRRCVNDVLETATKDDYEVGHRVAHRKESNETL